MILDDLTSDLVKAMKAGDKTRVDTMRFLLAGVRNMAIAKYGAASETSLTDADILDVVKKQVKTHRESVEAFTHAGRQDLVAKEHGELVILEAFLPKEMSDEELKKLLEPVVASGEKNFGLLMKNAMAAVAGRADGGRVAGMMKKML